MNEQNKCWVCSFYSRLNGVSHCHFGDTVERIFESETAQCENYVPLGELDIEED